MRTRRRFWWVFAVVTLLLAGVASYGASASPDGLDATTLRGCEVVGTDGGEELVGECIAVHAREHPLAGTPLADYTVAGRDDAVGAAGVIGVVVTLAVAGALFWALARARPRTRP